MNRRDFIKISGAFAGLSLIPVCNLAVAADPLLTSDDAQAKALGYVTQTAVPGSTCSNCLQSKGDPKAPGCNIFPGKQVSPTGWCKVWTKKP